jgi:hypothetical protein
VASPRRNEVAGEIARHLGAVSVLAVGVVHAQQYYGAYFSAVPTIGTLFLLSFVGSGVTGAVLMAPVRRLGRRAGNAILVAAALGAIAVAVGSLAALLISEHTPIFGFMESGYRPAIVLTLVFDGLTTAFLGVFLATMARRRRPHRLTTSRADSSPSRRTMTSSAPAPEPRSAGVDHDAPRATGA